MEKDVNGNEMKVAHIVDMHLNAKYKAAADKMAVDIELMRCQVFDLCRVADEGVANMDVWERSLAFASLHELRKNIVSMQHQIDDLAVATKAWTSKKLGNLPQDAKPVYEK